MIAVAYDVLSNKPTLLPALTAELDRAASGSPYYSGAAEFAPQDTQAVASTILGEVALAVPGIVEASLLNCAGDCGQSYQAVNTQPDFGPDCE